MFLDTTHLILIVTAIILVIVILHWRRGYDYEDVNINSKESLNKTTQKKDIQPNPRNPWN